LKDAAAGVREDVRAGPGSEASRAGLILTYCSLTLMTAATSFGARPVPVRAAAEIHHRAWELFVQRGRSEDAAIRDDINVQGYARRPLMLAAVHLVSEATGASWPWAFAAVRLGSIAAAYVLLRRLYRLWLDERATLAGCLFVAAAAALTFVGNNWEILSSFPELGLFAAAVHALCVGRPLVVTLLVLLGSLNRETMAFMVALAAADAVMGTRRRASVWATAGSLAAWLAALVAMHWWLSPLSFLEPFAHQVEHNLGGLALLAVSPHPYNFYLLPLYLLGPFWILPALRWRVLPPCLRACALTAPLFLVVVLVLGDFNEPRQLLLLFPVMVPAGLIALFGRPQEADAAAVR
jgi:hypothetical protein